MTPWSKNGNELSVEELTARLISIICIERKIIIPDKAPVIILVRKQPRILGNQAKEVIVIEEMNNSKLKEFEKNARDLKLEREFVGIGDHYAEMQPHSMPKINNSLLAKYLDICENIFLRMEEMS